MPRDVPVVMPHFASTSRCTRNFLHPSSSNIASAQIMVSLSETVWCVVSRYLRTYLFLISLAFKYLAHLNTSKFAGCLGNMAWPLNTSKFAGCLGNMAWPLTTSKFAGCLGNMAWPLNTSKFAGCLGNMAWPLNLRVCVYYSFGTGVHCPTISLNLESWDMGFIIPY